MLITLFSTWEGERLNSKNCEYFAKNCFPATSLWPTPQNVCPQSWMISGKNVKWYERTTHVEGGSTQKYWSSPGMNGKAHPLACGTSGSNPLIYAELTSLLCKKYNNHLKTRKDNFHYPGITIRYSYLFQEACYVLPSSHLLWHFCDWSVTSLFLKVLCVWRLWNGWLQKCKHFEQLIME